MAGAWSLERHTRLPSTNDRAKEWARQGAPSRSVVVALEQTRGRGRGAHLWSSPPGGLYASVVLRNLPRPATPLLALVGVMALHDAAAARFPGLGLWVKWPNDLLAGAPGEGRPTGKAGGVLVESGGTGEGLDWVVLGFGLNVAVDVAGLPTFEPPAVSLGALAGRAALPDDVLRSLLDALDAALERYGHDPARLVVDGNRVLAYRDETVEVTPRDRGAPLAGRLLGLAPDGALRLGTGEGERRVPAWDAASLRPLV